MKFIAIFCFLFLSGFVSAQWNEQVTIGFPGTEMGYYYKSNPIFNDRYYSSGTYSISQGNAEFYKKKKVKRVGVYDLSGTMHYFCDLDTNGRVTQDGHLGGTYFMTYKSVQLDQHTYWSITAYWQNNQLMRIDSTFNEAREYKKYNPGDTNYAYSINERLVYMRGDLINEQNRYYNEKYEGQYFDPRTVMYSFSTEPYLYFEKLLKTDYDSLKLYKTTDVRSAEGVHHYIGENRQEWEQVKDHPFFKGISEINRYEYYTDGADFSEPVLMQQRMSCGYSSYQTYYGFNDTGFRNAYCKDENGLNDTFQSLYYPEDPNPPVVEKTETPVDPSVIIMPFNSYTYKPVPRLTDPVITPLLIYRYEFY